MNTSTHDLIRITRAEGTWVVRTDDGVLAESKNALHLQEGGYPPVIYFPKADIGMAFLEASSKTSRCPHKGNASYYHLVGVNERVTDAAWSYDDPIDSVARIKDHIAFYTSKVFVEQL